MVLEVMEEAKGEMAVKEEETEEEKAAAKVEVEGKAATMVVEEAKAVEEAAEAAVDGEEEMDQSCTALPCSPRFRRTYDTYPPMGATDL